MFFNLWKDRYKISQIKNEHNNTSIISFIKNKYHFFKNNVMSNKVNRCKWLSKLYGVGNIVKGSGTVNVINHDNSNETPDLTIFTWLWVLEVNCRKKQQPNNLSVENGSHTGEYAATTVELSTETKLANYEIHTVGEHFYNLLISLSHIKSLITTKHGDLLDFNETTNIACIVGIYANNGDESINKIAKCNDLFGFLIDSRKIIEIVVFKDAHDIGFRNLNFGPSNRSHSTLLKTINKYQLNIQLNLKHDH